MSYLIYWSRLDILFKSKLLSLRSHAYPFTKAQIMVRFFMREPLDLLVKLPPTIIDIDIDLVGVRTVRTRVLKVYKWDGRTLAYL